MLGKTPTASVNKARSRQTLRHARAAAAAYRFLHLGENLIRHFFTVYLVVVCCSREEPLQPRAAFRGRPPNCFSLILSDQLPGLHLFPWLSPEHSGLIWEGYVLPNMLTLKERRLLFTHSMWNKCCQKSQSGARRWAWLKAAGGQMDRKQTRLLFILADVPVCRTETSLGGDTLLQT